MSGLPLINSALAGVAGAGVMLKSKRDYEQEVSRFEDQKAMNSERLKQAQQGTAIGADSANELERKRAGEAEERAATQDYIRRSSPGYQGFPMDERAPAPQNGGAQAAPVMQKMPDSGPAVAAEPIPNQSESEPVKTEPVAAAPTEQPIPGSAIPGQTLSSSPVKPPVAPTAPQAAPLTSGGAPSMSAPPRSAQPATAAAPAGPAQPGGGRAGLLDVLAEKALARGDKARYDQLQAEKVSLEKEGFAQAAHEALLDPQNVRKIEQVFNANGSRRIVPGSLVYKGNGTYSGAMLNPDGSTKPFENFNMLGAAMALGVIAPPKIQHFDASHTVVSQAPDGKITTLQEGHKFASAINRNGDIVTTNLQTGDTKVQTAGGGEGRLNPTQAAGVREIAQLTRGTAVERANQLPGQEGNKPKLDQAQVAGTAQNIYLNNPDLAKQGLNPARAAQIAIAINDKSPDAVTGTAMRNGELWNVVRYGKGKDAIVYGVSRSAQQPLPAAAPAPAPAKPAATAPAPRPAAPAPVATPAAPAAPTPLPKPLSPVERLGGAADQLKAAVKEAKGRLAAIGARELKKNPNAAKDIEAEIAQLESASKNAQAEYEKQAGTQQAATGRAFK